MDRRDALKLLGVLYANAYAVPAVANPCASVTRYGALAPTAPIRGRRFHEEFSTFKGLGKQLAKERKNVLLYQFLQNEIGEIKPYWQGPDPETGNEGEGDCCGQAGAMGCNVLAATDIWLRDEAEQFIAEASVEMLYGGSRYEIGVIGRPEENPRQENSLRGRGGSHGEWVARFVNEYGVLHRLIYPNPDGSQLDLTGYDPGRSRQYRDRGVPDWLEAEARKHPVRSIANIRTSMEGVDAICAGHPVLVCSSYAFMPERDERGFCKAYGAYRKRGRWFRVQWWHAMIATGVVFWPDGTIGVLIQNSHGDWNGGPTVFDQPRGSFFVTLQTFELMVKDWFDCWSLGSYLGHEVERVRKRIHKLWR